jgi:N-acetylmuramoyl-L-alanine amidase
MKLGEEYMRVFSIKVEELSIFLFIAIILSGIFYTANQEKRSVHNLLPGMSKVVIIDAGHGGWDPGKKGTQGADEKEINLQIAQKLQAFLEQGGATVYMTRTEDEALGTRKGQDMRERKSIINSMEGDILISIHQNAFPQASVKGAQVFYYKNSEKGKKLAETIQESLISFADNDNKRVAKSNNDYYVLRTTEIPAALVECGFLSNSEEEKKLNDEKYQEKIAWAIYLGIMNYFSGDEFAYQVWYETE